MVLAQIALLFQLVFAQPSSGVSVTTDMSAYNQGDAIQVTIHNGGSDSITKGGIVCDDVWPLAVDLLQPDGTWQAVPTVSRGNCLGIAGILFPPGASQTRTLALALDPGTYRIVYAFDVVGTGPAPNAGMVTYSDPFDVNP